MVKRSLASSGQVARNGRDVHVLIEPRNIALEVAAEVYGVSADFIVKLQDQEGHPVIRQGTRRLVPVRLADAWWEARATTDGRPCITDGIRS